MSILGYRVYIYWTVQHCPKKKFKKNNHAMSRIFSADATRIMSMPV